MISFHFILELKEFRIGSDCRRNATGYSVTCCVCRVAVNAVKTDSAMTDLLCEDSAQFERRTQFHIECARQVVLGEQR